MSEFRRFSIGALIFTTFVLLIPPHEANQVDRSIVGIFTLLVGGLFTVAMFGKREDD